MVPVRKITRLDHEVRIEEAARLIVAELDAPLEPSALADRVCMSRFHFHRVFQGLLGETVGDLSRRLRLERAASRLRTTDQPITCIAFEAGYATHEAFIKAFRQVFGCTPSVFRNVLEYDGLLPTPNGIHYNDPDLAALRFAPSTGGIQMNIELRELEPKRALCMSHRGPYYMIGQTFGKIAGWCGAHGVQPGMGIAVYYDDPQSVAPEQLRSDAGFLVDGDLRIEDPEVHFVDLPGGLYAVGTHVGPYEGLNSAWSELSGRWFPSSGCEFGSAPAFELYLNNCMEVKPEELVTEICMSVVRPAVAADR